MKNKDNNKKEKEYNFSVFDNYKCDGQLVMDFKDNKIDIVEENKHKYNPLENRI